MTYAKWTEFLRGHNGGLEVNRVVGAIGGLVYILGAHAFVVWELMMGRGFDIGDYCTWFPLGLATIVTGTGAGVALKDRQVASAKVIEATGSKPATPPAPAPKAQPELEDLEDERPDYAK